MNIIPSRPYQNHTQEPHPMNKIVSVAIVLTFVLMTLTACSDPLGLAAAEHERSQAQVQTEQIRADAATDQARISASTARLRYGSWMVGGLVAGVVIVAVVGIAGMVHLQAQRDRLRLTAEQWRAALPAQPSATALPTGRPRSQRPMLTQRRPAPAPTLALPERSEARNHDIVVIDG